MGGSDAGSPAPARLGCPRATGDTTLTAFLQDDRHATPQSVPEFDLRDHHVLAHADEDAWQEVIRLLVGQLSPVRTGAIIEALCPTAEETAEQGQRLGLAWLCLSEVAPKSLSALEAVCELLVDRLYAWIGDAKGIPPTGKYALEETLQSNEPGSWPVPVLSRLGFPERLSFGVMFPTAVPQLLGPALFAHEHGAFDILRGLAEGDADSGVRQTAVLTLGNTFRDRAETFDILRGVVENDGEALVRQAAVGEMASMRLEGAALKLATRDLDGVPLFFDPREPVDASRVRAAAEKLSMSEAEIRRAYEQMVDEHEIPLRLAWR